MKKFFSLLAVFFVQLFADTPEEWIAKANGVIKQEIRASGNSIRSVYSFESLKEASTILDSALKRFPYRIDVWLGQVQLNGEMENCKAQVEYFEKIHELLKTKRDKCELKDGEKIGNADELLEKEFTIAARKHFESENDPCYEMLARQMLKFLPNSVEALNAMSVVHLLQKSDSAIVYLERAYKLNTSDCVVIHNIAEFYKRKDNKKKYEEYTMKEALMCRQK
ncbi:lipopolysaccharide assembly protein LapB [Fibrobacter sp. UWH4]|uniref:tetratricopeptide repeat protein n=1 Tax=Fibrobacter sp. UWH4 TaxID=1896210 RepID=UPI00091B157B|nr:hypothetical protein [Fibrobacter sp. UWH4]SHL51358.1 hypothetical protein SAMN05720762_10770 [Fibrobacter sp. UWH4]